MSVDLHQWAEVTATGRPNAAQDVGERTFRKIELENLVVQNGTHYDQHYHGTDQLAWMGAGSMQIGADGATWHLRRGQFAWIPAGCLHEMKIIETGELINLYADPALRPSGARWSRPCVVGAEALAVSLLWHLIDEGRSPERIELCHRLFVDVLATSTVEHDVVQMPRDPRAAQVAEAVLGDPAQAHELSAWARRLGVSEKTLSRAFVTETGTTYRRWRHGARLHVAAGMLGEGADVRDVATAVGYASTSSFIASFSERFKITPGRYARAYASR